MGRKIYDIYIKKSIFLYIKNKILFSTGNDLFNILLYLNTNY